MRAGLQIQLIISKRLPITAGEVLRLSFDLISFANASNARYAINPVTGEIVGPYGAAVLAEIPVAGRRCLVLRGAANAFTDLGQQYSEGYVLALASLGDGIALAGTGPNGKILRSTNHGATWTDLGQQYSEAYILALASLGDGIALAGTRLNGKILRSTNHGATWTDLGQQYSQNYIFALASLGDGIALAGTCPNGKILRSTNHGATWTDLGQQYSQTDVRALASLGDGIALAGTSPNGKILRSTNHGATWTDLGQQYSQTDILALASLGGGIALAGTGTSGKILRSTNHGATWTDLGQQYSEAYIFALGSLGGGIALAGTHSGGKILRSKNNSYSQFKDQAFYTTAVVPVAFRNRVLSLRIPEYSSAELALCTPGSKRYLFRYADSGANAFGVYLLSTDQKLYAEVNGVNVAATATACTWSAYQQICARVDRAAGTVALTGMTTGDDALSFTPPAVSNGNLYLGMDDNEANQFEGFCAEPELW